MGRFVAKSVMWVNVARAAQIPARRLAPCSPEEMAPRDST